MNTSGSTKTKRQTKQQARRKASREAIQQLSRLISNGSVSPTDWSGFAATMSAVFDSGATSHCGREKDNFIPTNLPSTKVFHLPTGHTTAASKQAKLHHQVREPARTVDIVPGLKHNSLLSASKFADANYITILTPTEVLIYDGEDLKLTVSNEAVLRGWRDEPSGLWRVPLKEEVNNVEEDTILFDRPPHSTVFDNLDPTEDINNVYELPNTAQTIRYLHACAGYPTKSTWLTAIRAGNYLSWPMLTATAVAKHFPESDETQMGHMRNIKQGIRSTKEKIKPTTLKLSDGTDVTMPLKKHHDIYMTIDNLRETICTDQTGAFPVRSRSGNRYILVLCDIDSNAIFSEPMRNRTTGEMIRAYQAALKRLRLSGVRPKKHILDNELSHDYKQAIIDNEMQYELVPAGQHRRNVAEKAIQTWKAHFISVLCGVSLSFPMNLWDTMLEQVDMTCNMQRMSNANPKVSAHAYLNGPHDFNRMPLAPLGIDCMMYITPDKRKTFGTKAVKAWYTGTSKEHYRYYNGWCADTRATRGSETVFFKHKYITNPAVTPEDAVVHAAQELIDTLKSKYGNNVSNSGIDQLKSLSAIFNGITNKQKPATTTEDSSTSPRVKEKEAGADIEESTNEAVILETETPADNPPSTNESSEEATSPEPHWNPFSSNYITQDDDEEDTPAANTRSRYRSSINSITDEIMLTCVNMSSVKISPRAAAGRKYPVQLLCELAGAIVDGSTGELLEYRHLMQREEHKEVWGNSFGNEIGRLAQGIPGRVEGTDTIDFIEYDDIPVDRRHDVTYARIVCTYRNGKKDPNRTRITVGGNLINYPDDVGTPTADLLTVKLLLNSVVSTPGAKFMTLDIKNFYLCTPLKRKEYVRMKLEDFPEDIIELYDLKSKVKNGAIYVSVKRGMYGLPQSGILAQELLEERLNKHGYFQSQYTPGFWTHTWRPISFSLVVDDFGVKYVGKKHADHLIKALKEDYEIEEDWEGRKYVGLTFDWDYDKREVHLSVPGYVPKALHRFQHIAPKHRQQQPHKHNIPNYGAKQQFAKIESDEPILGDDDKKYIQQVLGTFLFYARAVDSTMLVALSAIASEQATPTESTMNKVKLFLDFAASQEEAIVTYRASDMVLAIHSDASYLSEPKARSRAGGHFFMSSDSENPANNGAVLNIAQIIKAVMTSAAEAEIGAMFINGREAVPARKTLEEMGHPQPRTPMQTDNTAAHSVVTNNIAPKRTKAMDMRFHWLRCRDAQGQFRYYWRPGVQNWGDYWTKHHPGPHHQNMRVNILTPKKYLDNLRRRREGASKSLEIAQALYELIPTTRVC